MLNRSFFARKVTVIGRDLSSISLLRHSIGCSNTTGNLSNKIALTNVYKRYKTQIDESSWAVDGLKKQGEKVAPAPSKVKFYDDAAFEKPEPKIEEMVQAILALNVVEIHQMLNMLQVSPVDALLQHFELSANFLF
jgi:hypothetical protein